MNELKNITGLGRSSIYKFMEEGKFPQSISLGERAVRWEEGEIDEWMQSKVDSRADNVIKQREEKPKKITEDDVIAFIKDKFKQFTIADAVTWLAQIIK